MKEFFEEFYQQTVNVIPMGKPPLEVLPAVLEEEVWKQLHRMKKRTAPGHDSIMTMQLRVAESEMVPLLASLYTRMLQYRVIPPGFGDSITTLISKKDHTDLSNFRPISILPAPYKLFTRVLLARMHRSLEFNQPAEQAGFRRSFSTVEHLHTIKQLIDKAYGYRNYLYLVFVDFRKTYDTIGWNAVWNSLQRHGADQLYMEMLQKVYTDARCKIKVQEDLVDVDIKRGVRQGCVLSPLLFNAVLEDVFREVNWDDIGFTINGRKLNHLRYADDVVLVGKNLQAVQCMMTELEQAGHSIGLVFNLNKTGAMTNAHEGQPIRFVQHFVYLGSSVTCTSENQELSRKIGAGWAAFNRHRLFLTKRSIPMRMKRKVYLT